LGCRKERRGKSNYNLLLGQVRREEKGRRGEKGWRLLTEEVKRPISLTEGKGGGGKEKGHTTYKQEGREEMFSFFPHLPT